MALSDRDLSFIQGQWDAAHPKSSVSQAIIDRFPAFATLLGIPEISNLVEQASAPGNNWSPTYFREQLWNTHWWKTTPETARNWQMTKLNDPATAGQQAGTIASNIVAVSTSLGLHLSPGEIAHYSELAAAGGWDDKALTRTLVDDTANKRYTSGAVFATKDALTATAASYGVPMSDKTLMQWSKDVQTGRQTTQGFEDFAKMHAKAAFPTLSKELDAGLTVKQIADPYLQIAGQTLGINPETMSLTDPKWQHALQSRDAKGHITGPMTTLDWQRTLMTDNAYGYDHSENAKSAALDMRKSLAETFGVSA